MSKATRMTRQKRVILNVLRSTKSHPTADWVYLHARQELPNLSLGTVYRNLNVLKEMGEIMELNYGSTFSRFDGNPVQHYHFVCEDCGQVLDLDFPMHAKLNELAAATLGAEISHHRLEFYGCCQECLQKKAEQPTE
ncbi:MAG TPA: transcriptional repressor [Bacillota bacterium]|nr:transcriptional repressor [Bacillota bacterium]